MTKILHGRVNLDDMNSTDFAGDSRIELNLAVNSDIQNNINVIDTNIDVDSKVDHDDSDNGIPNYGVSEVITLLHSLPNTNSDTVLMTAIRTIESFGVDIDSIIDDAIVKEDLTFERLTVLKQEIEQFSKDIMAREEEVDLLEVGLTEVVKAREYLERGMSLINSSKKKPKGSKKVDIKNFEDQKTREITMVVLNNPVKAKKNESNATKPKASKRKKH